MFLRCSRGKFCSLETSGAGNNASRVAKLGNIEETCARFECLWKDVFLFPLRRRFFFHVGAFGFCAANFRGARKHGKGNANELSHQTPRPGTCVLCHLSQYTILFEAGNGSGKGERSKACHKGNILNVTNMQAKQNMRIGKVWSGS